MHISSPKTITWLIFLIACQTADSCRALVQTPDENESTSITDIDVEAYFYIDSVLGSINAEVGSNHQLFIQQAAILMQTLVDSINVASSGPETSRGGEIRGSQLKFMKDLYTSYTEAELCHGDIASATCATIGMKLVAIEMHTGVKLENLDKYLAALVEKITICHEYEERPARRKNEDDGDLVTRILRWLSLAYIT